MFCPNDMCPDYLDSGVRSEYRDEVTTCPYCGAYLVRELQPSDGGGVPELPAKPAVAADEEMEPVYETLDLTEVAVIKALFDGAAMPYLTRNEEMYDAFRGAFGGTMFNPLGRPVVFLVPARMAEEARDMLEEFDEADSDGGCSEGL